VTDQLKIIFAGTPEFSVPPLNALIESPHEVIAVYTQPDRPAGRAAGATGLEAGYGKFGGSRENQPQPRAIQALAACLRCFSSRFSNMLRLSADR
jgi:hypothetical protein